MEIIILDGKQMTSVAATHQYLAKTLRLPAYYGGNLDALADCLSEFGPSVCLLLINQEELRQQLGPYAQRLLAVFQEVGNTPGCCRWLEWAE